MKELVATEAGPHVLSLTPAEHEQLHRPGGHAAWAARLDAFVLGLDPSLDSFGLAVVTPMGSSTWRYSSARKLDVYARLGHLRECVRAHLVRLDHLGRSIHPSPRRLACIEGPSYGSAQSGAAHARAGLWWMVYDTLAREDWPIAVISPRARALYGSGNGDHNKREVLAGARELFADVFDFSPRPGRGDELDALILATMGAHWLGSPIVDVPSRNASALAKVGWPEFT